MGDDHHNAWDELHAATPSGWYVGRPGQRHGGQWAMYAFDTTERAQMGHRSRELDRRRPDRGREMARCLRELGEGRVPQ